MIELWSSAIQRSHLGPAWAGLDQDRIDRYIFVISGTHAPLMRPESTRPSTPTVIMPRLWLVLAAA